MITHLNNLEEALTFLAEIEDKKINHRNGASYATVRSDLQNQFKDLSDGEINYGHFSLLAYVDIDETYVFFTKIK